MYPLESRSSLELPMIVLWVIQQSHTMAGFLNKVSESDDVQTKDALLEHPFQDSIIEGHGAVDLCWLLTWSIVKCQDFSSVKSIKGSAVSPMFTQRNKDKACRFWPVTLEELPNIPQVTVWRWQVIVWTCTNQNRTDLNRSSHRCLPAAAAVMYKSYCVLDASETGTCMTVDVHNADSPGLSPLVSSQGWGVYVVHHACIHLLCFFYALFIKGGWGWRDGWP